MDFSEMISNMLGMGKSPEDIGTAFADALNAEVTKANATKKWEAVPNEVAERVCYDEMTVEDGAYLFMYSFIKNFPEEVEGLDPSEFDVMTSAFTHSLHSTVKLAHYICGLEFDDEEKENEEEDIHECKCRGCGHCDEKNEPSPDDIIRAFLSSLD